MTKEEIKTVVELFISWNGEEDPIDTSNLNSAVDYINECLRPSLPSDLDEAAEWIASDIAPDYPDISWDACYEKIKEGIKAGSEWMAGQGWHEEAAIKGSDDVVWLNYNVELPIDLAKYFKDGDKVIVQIRKK